MTLRARFLLCLSFLLVLLPLPAPAAPPAHDQFKVAVYIPVSVVERMKDPAYLQQSWDAINTQVKVDKVYIESYRSGVVADDALLETVKKFFLDRGVQVAGGIAFTGTGGGGQFVSLCYTDAKDRALVRQVSQLTARHFNEIILDDFFFNNTKYDSDIAARGAATWTQFRLRLMDSVARNLVVGAARSVNPKVKVIVKFPNWYPHFQALGYDLDQEPKIFAGIYTGTETRDPVITDQHLQQYESYQILRYFDNIAPGRNGGGWVDTYDIRYIDRYAEQLWDTMLAKAPQIVLFEWADLLRPVRPGDRAAWSALPTTFQMDELDKWHADSGATAAANLATVAGYSLSRVNRVLGKLGTPIGIAAYRPYQSTGEDFLLNYLGMIGIPIDLHPEFPTKSKTILLTGSAKYDPAIVSKIQTHLQQGGNVIVTSGLLRALQGQWPQPSPIGRIAEIRTTGNVLSVSEYWGAFGPGGGSSLGTSPALLVPEISFMTNDAWALVRGTANGRGAPLLLMDRYSKGVFYVLNIPENPTDLYSLPQPVLTAIRRYLLADFPVTIDAPAKVSLFAYDNGSFVVESYLDAPTTVTVLIKDELAHLRNLATNEVVDGVPVPEFRRNPLPQAKMKFKIEIPPHSFAAFAEEP